MPDIEGFGVYFAFNSIPCFYVLLHLVGLYRLDR